MSRTLIRFLGHLGGHSSSLWARSGPNSSTVALGFLLNPEVGSDSTPFWGRPIFILNQFSRANLRQFRPNPAPSRLEGVQEDTKYDLTRAKTSSVNFRVIAASGYVRAVADLFRPWVSGHYTALGTDGFGRSDTPVALRKFFEVDRNSIAIAAIAALSDEGVAPEEIASPCEARFSSGITLTSWISFISDGFLGLLLYCR